jgi:hypothetical protein
MPVAISLSSRDQQQGVIPNQHVTASQASTLSEQHGGRVSGSSGIKARPDDLQGGASETTRTLSQATTEQQAPEIRERSKEKSCPTLPSQVIEPDEAASSVSIHLLFDSQVVLELSSTAAVKVSWRCKQIFRFENVFIYFIIAL